MTLCKALSIAKKSDFLTFWVGFYKLSIACMGPRLTVQTGVNPGLRDYNQSFVPTPESREIGFYFVAMDTMLLYITIGMK